MLRQHAAVPPIYPIDPWAIVETAFAVEHNYRNEAIFALGNGVIGVRGGFEEGYAGPPGTSHDGTYLNGFYESEPIRYPEPAYGYAEHSQTMLNVTNGKIIRLFVDDEEFSLFTGTILSHQRALRLQTGLLERSAVWRSPAGREIALHTERLVSFTHPQVCAIRYTVTPLNFSGRVRLVSLLDGDVINLTTGSDPRQGSGLQGRVLEVEQQLCGGELGALGQRVRNTGFPLVCAMHNRLHTPRPYRVTHETAPLAVSVVYTIDAVAEQPITLDKFVAYAALREPQAPLPMEAARAALSAAVRAGYETLRAEQAAYLERFWAGADIVIEGDPALQQGLRFNLFHLLQAAGRDGQTSVGGKGLTGEGYEGHYFWDTEMYVFPFFLYTMPEVSRALLEYRFNTLERARARARQMAHHRGALFPWRTINGDECSAYFPAGTAQYHINADIAFAIRRYLEVTGDTQFMIRCGVEVLIETARLWADLGAYIPRKGGQFCINGVTGPDEYTAIVNNNCYTNLMARENLRSAVQQVRWLRAHAPEAYQALAARLGLEDAEIEAWQRAAEALYIPYDAELGLYLQDDSFLDKAPWDFEHTPPENYPLLIHYHPLVIYRHQVCKQADLLLAMLLLDQQFTREEKARNYAFYERVTTHDSSLSTSIFSALASQIGDAEKAYAYFMHTARLDLDDHAGNVKDGVHIANMAGTWMCVVNGFAGMGIGGERLRFHPYLPVAWQGYRFQVHYQGRAVRVEVTSQAVTYTLLEGQALEIEHGSERLILQPSQPVERPTRQMEV